MSARFKCNLKQVMMSPFPLNCLEIENLSFCVCLLSILWCLPQQLCPYCDVFLLWSLIHPRSPALSVVEEVHHADAAGGL